MTQVYPPPAAAGGAGAAATPGAHVLLIGVGSYPHLGAGEKNLVEEPMGLGQLTSPAPSVGALFEWFRGRTLAPPRQVGYNNPYVPLASIEICCSPREVPCADGANFVVEEATKANIEACFGRWLQRCKQHPGNISVLYFCGHGVMVANHYLLASDFGTDENQPWSSAFDITTTLKALERELAGPIYFFIDACRQIPRALSGKLGANPLALRPADLDKAIVNTSRALYEAAGEGRQAFGPPAEPSRFTTALIQSLSGYAGRKIPGVHRWEVNGDDLANSIRTLLEIYVKQGAKRQILDPAVLEPTTFHVATAQPMVKVALDLLPPPQRANFLLHLKQNGLSKERRDAAGCPLDFEVGSGIYELGAYHKVDQGISHVLEPENLSPPAWSYVFTL
ncbi:MAG TPA: caspase family protein [Burkholderiales bacterium]|nr:caspase family protein [Burkholderiales bacterium]